MTMKQKPLIIIPITFAAACDYITLHHRHHKKPVGLKFCLAVAKITEKHPTGKLVGVATVGRPVARHFDNGFTVEVTRTATDGTPNANSALYGAAWRAAKALGYTRMITYTQDGESGASLRAAGMVRVRDLPPRTGWTTPSRPRESHGVDGISRVLWELKTS